MRPLRSLVYVYRLDCQKSVCTECHLMRITADGSAFCTSEEPPEGRIQSDGKCTASVIPFDSTYSATGKGSTGNHSEFEGDSGNRASESFLNCNPFVAARQIFQK